MTNDWVFYQSSEIIDAAIDLIKPLSNLVIDTTSLPTDLYSYFPIFPRTLIPNSIYSIYRPANEGDGWGYSGVYREFNVKNVINWKDQYGSDLGFEVIIKHVLFGFTIMFNLIIDKHGGKFRAFRTPIPGDSGQVFRINSDSDSGLISDRFVL